MRCCRSAELLAKPGQCAALYTPQAFLSSNRSGDASLCHTCNACWVRVIRRKQSAHAGQFSENQSGGQFCKRFCGNASDITANMMLMFGIPAQVYVIADVITLTVKSGNDSRNVRSNVMAKSVGTHLTMRRNDELMRIASWNRACCWCVRLYAEFPACYLRAMEMGVYVRR